MAARTGGQGDDLNEFSGRGDLDVILAWQIENLGAGNRARCRERASQTRAARMLIAQTRELIANQVAEAHYELTANIEKMDLASSNLANAADAMEKTMERIRGLQGDPLELIQSLDAMSLARRDFVDAVTDHNISQLNLLRSIGTPVL